MTWRIEISGNAGTYEAAAIAAVIARIAEEETAATADRPRAPRPSPWVRAYQGFHADDPLPVLRPQRPGSPR